MCTVSAIGDNWKQRLPDLYPTAYPVINDGPTRAEFAVQVAKNAELAKEVERLKKELAELKKLFDAAKLFDQATGQPDCETDEKVRVIRDLAKLLNVESPL